MIYGALYFLFKNDLESSELLAVILSKDFQT
jgi:hypothetical protein